MKYTKLVNMPPSLTSESHIFREVIDSHLFFVNPIQGKVARCLGVAFHSQDESSARFTSNPKSSLFKHPDTHSLEGST